ncbi:MAG: extracellular solute-binding protein [Acetivibrio sp.]
MKKKALALLMATTMIASLVGCGNKNEPAATDNTTTDAKTEEPAAEPEAEPEEEAITTTLTVWSPSEDQAEEQGKWLQTMCEQFKTEHPNWDITFEYGVCAEGDAKATVTQDVEAAADVYMYANDNLTDLIASNAIAKLGGDTAEYVKSTNSQAIVDSVSVDGNIYGVPFTTNTWFMYYDKSVYSEEDASSLDTMLEKGKIAFPLTNSWNIASFYVANGGTMFGDGTDEAAGIVFNGDNGVAVTNYLVDLVNNKNFVNDADGAGIAGLRDGSINAIFSGSWDGNAVKEILGDNFGARQLPTIAINGETKQMMAFAGSKAIGVNPTCEYPQVAVALAQYLGSKEAQQSHYDLRSVVPCNTELLADPTLQSDALVVAQNATFDTTSIIQPFVPAMGNYWGPAENFGKSLINKEITHDNAAEKTEELNTSMNTSLAE